MILERLVQVAEAEGLLDTAGYEQRRVFACIDVDAAGHFLRVRPLHAPGEPRDAGARLLVPRLLPGETRTGVAPAPRFLVDNVTFLLGSASGREAAARVRPAELDRRRRAFASLVKEALDATALPTLEAVHGFLESEPERSRVLRAARRLAGFTGTRLLCICASVGGADRAQRAPVHLSPAVVAYWQKRRRARSDSQERERRIFCVATGSAGIRAEAHPTIAGAPGSGPLGASLVSFNDNAYESYGWKRHENASICREGAEAYTAGLTRLLAPSTAPASGSPTYELRVDLTKRCAAVLWSDDRRFAAELARALEGDGKAQHAVCSRAQKVDTAASSPRAWALVLCGAMGRLSVRSMLESSTRGMACAFRAFAIDAGKDPRALGGAPLPSLGRLLRACSPLERSEEASPELAVGLLRAVLIGEGFARGLLQAVLERIRGERSRGQSPVSEDRAVLLRAWLTRSRRKDHGMRVEEQLCAEDYIGALLGRLFSCLQRMHALARGDEAGPALAARHFAAAGLTPRTVFPRLLEAEVRHYAEARATDSTEADLVHETVRSLCARLLAHGQEVGGGGGLPPFLPLEEQGLFALSYHWQSAALAGATVDSLRGDSAR